MGFNLWYGNGSDDAVSLGDPFAVMRSFGEMAELLTSLDEGSEGGPYAELFSVPLYGEQDADRRWFGEVKRQAKALASAYGRHLSPHGRWILSQLGAAPVRPESSGGRRINNERTSLGISATGLTSMELGGLMDYQFQMAGYRPILPPWRRRNPLDREWNLSGHLFEVTACSTYASVYRAKVKKSEIQGKISYAQKYQATPYTMITVLDFDEKQIHMYWREGIGSFILERATWHYAGTIHFTTKELKRYRKAAKRPG
jgi:hypothetical protein